MRIIFAGTPEFARVALQRLLDDAATQLSARPLAASQPCA